MKENLHLNLDKLTHNYSFLKVLEMDYSIYSKYQLTLMHKIDNINTEIRRIEAEKLGVEVAWNYENNLPHLESLYYTMNELTHVEFEIGILFNKIQYLNRYLGNKDEGE